MYGSINETTESSSTADERVRFYGTLCNTASGQIFQITSKSSTLDKYLKFLGGQQDDEALRERIHNLEVETNRLVQLTTENLKQLGELAALIADKVQRVRAEKLRNEFHECLKRYVSVQKQIAVKVKLIESEGRPQRASAQAAGDNSQTNPFVDPEDPFDLSALEEQRLQKQATLAAEEAVLAERQRAIVSFESDILDINEIFKDLGRMVHEQGEVISNIEDNVDQTYANVNTAQTELAAAEKYSRRARKKKICCLILAVVALVILILVIYFSLKH